MFVGLMLKMRRVGRVWKWGLRILRYGRVEVEAIGFNQNRSFDKKRKRIGWGLKIR
jgi:hypothetical protein